MTEFPVPTAPAAYTAFAAKELRAAPSAVLCSAPLSSMIYAKTGNPAAPVFIPVRAGRRAGMWIDMDKLLLIRPSPEMESAALDYKKEHADAGETELHGGALLECMDYVDWLEQVTANRDAATCRKDWVPEDTFFAVRESDGRIVGMVDVRRRLNDFLASFGGHIGYGVRPSERRKGYATQMLRLALDHARGLGLKSVMIACYADNTGSRRTIERCGGVLRRSFTSGDSRTVCVYDVTLDT